MNNEYIDKCPITDSSNGISYLDLGNMPLVNNLLETREESINCQRFPLKINYFKESGLSMLSYSVDKDLMFKYYTYKSGISLPYIEHCKAMFSFLDTYLKLNSGDRVLDVGGNDGTLLKSFKSIKPELDVLNVDISENIIEEARKKGVPSLVDFWGIECAKKLNKKFKLITSTNVFQHTLPINDFVSGISYALEKSGIWCLEFPYWKNTLETNQYDQVYHEHLYYYLIKPISLLLDKHGLHIIKSMEVSIHGGSMRLLIAHKDSPFSVCESVKFYMQKEIMEESYYINWGKGIETHIKNCKEYILNLKRSGYTIAGFGAAAKGCVFLNSLELDDTVIDYVVDDTDLKQNKFIPGTGIRVVSREHLKKNPTDYLIVLAHNFSDYIIKSLDTYKGKFIVMIPEIKTI